MNRESPIHVLWLDDERNPIDYLLWLPLTYIETERVKLVWVKNEDEFKAQIYQHEWSIISFDNDLGEGQTEGKDIFKYLEELLFTNALTLNQCEVQVHSGNPSARKNIQAGINNLQNHRLVR